MGARRSLCRWAMPRRTRNGHHLGRYWNIGPQKRLYCPAGWLKRGANEIVVLDLHPLLAAPVAGFAELEPAA